MHLVPAPEESDETRAVNAAWRAEARSLKGALVHLQQVHPAICNGVSRCCQLMATPTRESHAAAKRILAWLSNRADLGITYGAPHLRSASSEAGLERPRRGHRALLFTPRPSCTSLHTPLILTPADGIRETPAHSRRCTARRRGLRNGS